MRNSQRRFSDATRNWRRFPHTRSADSRGPIGLQGIDHPVDERRDAVHDLGRRSGHASPAGLPSRLCCPGRAPAVVSGPGLVHELEDSHSPGWDEVGDDERGREEEQAEDEVPDEAVALAASQNAITIQTKAHKIHHKIGMTYPPRVPCGTLLRAAEWQLWHRGSLGERSPMHFQVSRQVAVRAPGTVSACQPATCAVSTRIG
jgi:hypothetical protein